MVCTPFERTNGRHVTGTTGSFGAAAAIAKLLNLSSAQFKMALGHAASLAGGTRSANGTDTKTLHMGRGAQNGILAAVLAQQDFDTGEDPIGYWGKLVSPTVDLSYLTNDLGSKWELLENTFKPYPCGIVIHPLIDGCLALHDKGVRTENIKKLEVAVNPQCMRLCFVRHPETALQAIFSLYHGCAVALLYGAAGRKEFLDEVCNDSLVASIRDKIDVTTDAKLRDDEAQLRVIFKDGKHQDEHVDHAKGSLERPMTEQDLERKFIDQSELIMGLEKCRKIMKACWTIDEIEDISTLLELCRTE
jgi:aconitate decarboxylase